jgi:hypothetical protein
VSWIRSATRRSSIGTVRTTPEPTISSVALTVVRTRNVSAECAATHLLTTLMKCQTSPSFLRQ